MNLRNPESTATATATSNFREIARLAAWVLATVLTIAASFYSLKARVDAHDVAIQELKASKASSEATAGDIKNVIQRIDAIDRRLSDTRDETLKRLDRIEANQTRRKD